MNTILPEDKAVIKAALGSNVQIFAATVIKLYVATPDPTKWTDTNLMGAIVLLKDLSRNAALFFRLVDLSTAKAIWDQEIYMELDYIESKPFFHTFASDKYMVGFSFAEEREAIQFKEILYRKTNKIPTLPVKNLTTSNDSLTQATAPKTKSSYFWSSEKSESKKREISGPSNFRHLAHIGFDASKGTIDMKNIPPEWKIIIDKAGITPEQLENKETAKLVAKFIQTQGAAAIKSTSPPPPQKVSNVAELSPPSLPTRSNIPPPPPVQSGAKGGSIPPPPPPPSGLPTIKQEQESTSTQISKPKAVIPEIRNDLLSSIRAGGASVLRPVSPVPETNSSAPVEDPTDLMASLLAKALSDRNKKISHDSDDEDEDEDEEW